MKKCSKCKEEKQFSEFAFRSREKETYQPWCRKCHNKIHREMWVTNSKYRNKAKERNSKVKEENQKFIFQYLSKNPCVDCGISDIRVLEFDHVKEKTMEISYGCKTTNVQKLSEEIQKCEVVCANCHKIRTYSRLPKCNRMEYHLKQ